MIRCFASSSVRRPVPVPLPRASFAVCGRAPLPCAAASSSASASSSSSSSASAFSTCARLAADERAREHPALFQRRTVLQPLAPAGAAGDPADGRGARGASRDRPRSPARPPRPPRPAGPARDRDALISDVPPPPPSLPPSPSLSPSLSASASAAFAPSASASSSALFPAASSALFPASSSASFMSSDRTPGRPGPSALGDRGDFGARFGPHLGTWGQAWRAVDPEHAPRTPGKLPIKYERFDSASRMPVAQQYRGKYVMARLLAGRRERTGPFTDMQRRYRGKLEVVLRVRAAREAREAAAVAAAEKAVAAGEVGGKVPFGLKADRPASASASAPVSAPAAPDPDLRLRLPLPRAAREPSLSLTVVASKLRVSKFAVERRHAIARVRAAFAHVIAHSPHCPVSTQHCYFVHVSTPAAYDAVPFRSLCEEAEHALTAFARAIIAKENADRRGGAGARGRARGAAGGSGGGAGGGERHGRSADRRDSAKRQHIWRGTGVA